MKKETQIYGVENFLSIVDHEQDRHRSSESDDGIEHIVRDSSNSCKETEIKRGSTKQTQISVSVLFEFLECLDDIVHASVIYGSRHISKHTL